MPMVHEDACAKPDRQVEALLCTERVSCESNEPEISRERNAARFRSRGRMIAAWSSARELRDLATTSWHTAVMRDETERVLCQAGAPTVDEIISKACVAAFGDLVVENVWRGLLVEIIVGAALGAE